MTACGSTRTSPSGSWGECRHPGHPGTRKRGGQGQVLTPRSRLVRRGRERCSWRGLHWGSATRMMSHTLDSGLLPL